LNPYKSIENETPGRVGCRIHYFEEVGSTQDVARELAQSGCAAGTVVIAELQTKGRGRMGRAWHSPAGVNLYTTIVVRPRMKISEVARMSLVAGVAAADTLAPLAPGIVGLKWPNDIWLSGRKSGGIISEAVTDSSGSLTAAMLGIGLNLNLRAGDIPPELRDKATSLLIATGVACDRVGVAAGLFSNLDRLVADIESGGFAAIRPAWERYSALTGKQVTVVDAGIRETGKVRGIDDDGALLLETPSGVRRIIAGDVTLEGAYS